jgi:molybdopterin-binding protein
MKLSARNVLKGKVTKIIPGSVNSEVIIELPGGRRNRIGYNEKFGRKS